MRDGAWMRIPSNLLVADDVVQLLPGETTPADIVALRRGSEPLDAGQAVPGAEGSGASEWRVLSTPLLTAVGEFLASSTDEASLAQAQSSIVTHAAAKLERELGWLLIVLLALVAALQTIRFLQQDSEPGALWAPTLVPICIAVLPLSREFVAALLETLASAALLAQHEMLHTSESLAAWAAEGATPAVGEGRPASMQASPAAARPFSTWSATESEPGGSGVATWSLSVGELYESLSRVFDGDYLTQVHGLYPAIGRVTALCVIDREGSLVQDTPLVAEVAVPHADDNGDGRRSAIFSPERPHNVERSFLKVLKLTPDAELSTGVRFERTQWTDEIATLKPLALNTLLNTGCVSCRDSLAGRPAVLHRQHEIAGLSDCLSPLGRQIGFHDSALKPFKPILEMHVRASPGSQAVSVLAPGAPPPWAVGSDRSHPLRCLKSTVVESRGYGQSRSELQVFSRGEPSVVIDRCTMYWDGESLRPLNDECKEQLHESLNQWKQAQDICPLGLSYAPVTSASQRHALSLSSNSGGVTAELDDISDQYEDDGDRSQDISTAVPLRATDWLRIFAFAAESPDGYRQIGAFAQTCRAARKLALRFVLLSFTQDHVFLGMTALRFPPKPNTDTLLEQLNVAGIRFQYYCPMAERAAKVFGDRLKLETDWNSCISLTDRREAEGENGQEQESLGQPHGPARLPVGISMIRKHLADDVDNVPLLVPLYADATPTSTREMLQIMRDHGEVVCVVGGSFAPDFATVYCEADLAVVVDHRRPEQSACAMCSDKPQALRQSRDRREWPPLEALGASLASISAPMSLQPSWALHRLTCLVSEGRRYLANSLQSMCWLYAACATLALTEFLGVALRMPTVMSTGQVLWLVLVLVPAISISLLATQWPSSDPLKSMPLKNTDESRNQVIDVLASRLQYAVRFGPVVLGTVAVFQLVLSAQAALDQDRSLGEVLEQDTIFAGNAGNESTPTQVACGQAYAMAFFSWSMLVTSHSHLQTEHVTHSMPLSSPRLRLQSLSGGLGGLGGIGWTVLGLATLILGHRFARRGFVSQNRVWLLVAGAAMAAQLLFSGLQVSSSSTGDDCGAALLEVLSWWALLAMLALWPTVLCVIDELVRHIAWKKLSTVQKRRRLNYDTRLGMYSPVARPHGMP